MDAKQVKAAVCKAIDGAFKSENRSQFDYSKIVFRNIPIPTVATAPKPMTSAEREVIEAALGMKRMTFEEVASMSKSKGDLDRNCHFWNTVDGLRAERAPKKPEPRYHVREHAIHDAVTGVWFEPFGTRDTSHRRQCAETCARALNMLAADAK